jgi:hypothetical protein
MLFISLSLSVPYGSCVSAGYAHVDVPRRVEHDDAALAEHREVEVAQVAVDPLLGLDLLLLQVQPVGAELLLLVLLVDLVVDVLAVVHVPAGVQVRAVAERVVGVRHDDLLEVDVFAHLAQRPVHLALVFRAVLAEVDVLVVLLLELPSAQATASMMSLVV